MANTATPYTDIAKAYEQKARERLAQQEAQMAAQLAASKKSTNASYDSAASANYINYMRQRNALPEQLAAQGIRGGASESAIARIGNNYALNQGNTAASRNAAIGQLQSTYDTNLANARLTAEENIANNNMELAQAQVQYEDTLAQRAAEEARYQQERADAQQAKRLEQYAATISRYTTVESCDKAIEKLKKSNDPNKEQMIWLLKQRRAEIKQSKKGSGGGGRSSGRSSGGYSGGGYSSGSSSKSNGGGSKSTSSNTSSVSKGASAVKDIASGASKKATKQKAVRANAKNKMSGKSYKKGGGLLQR